MTEFSIEPSTNGQSIDYDSTLEDSCYDEVPLVSDRVHNLANNIYQEFEIMIEKYGNTVVEKLMPLIIGMLESMDQLYAEKRQLDIELELAKEDKEQVVSQYEREKIFRKLAEEKFLKIEDDHEGMKKDLEMKIESLESMLKIMELKAKNSQEHVSRFEEKEVELKKDYNQLHERYTELFRSHMEYIDRTKVLIQQQSTNPAILSSSMTTTHKLKHELHPISQTDDRVPAEDSADNQKSDWKNEFHEDELQTESNKTTHVTPDQNVDFETAMAGMETINDSLFSEGNDFEDFLKFDDSVTGEELDDTEINPTGVSREIENLIRENTDLIETKHALNIVKDDLITKVDDLTGENMMFREEINTLNTIKENYKEKISNLEKANRSYRDELEIVKNKLHEYEKEDDSPVDESKQLDATTLTKSRFTRAEMACVLQERNMYKERLFELQESVRLAEELRAKKFEEKQRQSSESESEDWKVLDKLWSPLLGGPISAVDDENLRPEKELTVNSAQNVSRIGRSKSLLNYFGSLLWDTLAPEPTEPSNADHDSGRPPNQVTTAPSTKRRSPYRRHPPKEFSSGGISLLNPPLLTTVRRSPGTAQRLSRTPTISNPLLSVASGPITSSDSSSDVSTSVASVRLLADEVHLLPVINVDSTGTSLSSQNFQCKSDTCNGIPFDV